MAVHSNVAKYKEVLNKRNRILSSKMSNLLFLHVNGSSLNLWCVGVVEKLKGSIYTFFVNWFYPIFEMYKYNFSLRKSLKITEKLPFGFFCSHCGPPEISKLLDDSTLFKAINVEIIFDVYLTFSTVPPSSKLSYFLY